MPHRRWQIYTACDPAIPLKPCRRQILILRRHGRSCIIITPCGSRAADLNADGYPEVYVYVTSAGSGSYGSLIAYASNRNHSISPIYLPPLEDDPEASRGYMGHYRFAVGEGALLRNFPLYEEGDTNAAPTGGTRQIQYHLQAGEAGWHLVPYRLFDF